MVNRHVVGAHYGLRDWMMQRITAIVMIAYTVLLVLFLVTKPEGYEAWQLFFKDTWVQIFSTISFLALFLHVWVGIRDLWMDYIKPVGLRLTLHVLTILWLVSCFIYACKIVWSV